VALASANRDPRQFGDTADQLDITRADAREHVAFGGGAHYCLGAALARLEAQTAIGSLVERFPTIEAAADPVYNGRINLRGLDTYELTLS
jgi:cytochrome P450